MRPTDDLHFVAEANGIIIRQYEVPDNRSGIYVHTTELGPHIVLSPDLREGTVAYRATLAHELGHHFTLAGDYGVVEHNEMAMALGKRWDNRADLWAINFMVRTSTLGRLYESRYNPWEIAEMLVVPERWVTMKLRWFSSFNSFN